MQTTPAWLTLPEFLLMLLEESYYLHPGADTCSESKHVFRFPSHRKTVGSVSVLFPACSYFICGNKRALHKQHLVTSFPSHFQVSVFYCNLSFLLQSLTNYTGHWVLPQGRKQQVAVSLGELFKNMSQEQVTRNSVFQP